MLGARQVQMVFDCRISDDHTIPSTCPNMHKLFPCFVLFFKVTFHSKGKLWDFTSHHISHSLGKTRGIQPPCFMILVDIFSLAEEITITIKSQLVSNENHSLSACLQQALKPVKPISVKCLLIYRLSLPYFQDCHSVEEP